MKLIIGTIALVALGLGIWYVTHPKLQSIPAAEKYQNDVYAYSFTPPANLGVQEYTPENVSVGIRTDEGFNGVAEVAVVGSGEEGGYESFDEYTFERGRLICAADGPDEAISCPRIVSRSPFTTTHGIVGEALEFELVRTTLSTGTTATTTYGPVYAFNIGANVPDSKFAVLLVYPSLPAYIDSGNASVSREIADTLQIMRIEPR